MPPKRYECPDCEGEGHFETMTNLFYNGNSTWKVERCERCDGTGYLDEDQLTEEELENQKER